jgi:glycosyltransferase involved in cell wall biosynthesis
MIKILSESYKVGYIGFFEGFESKSLENVNVIHVQRTKSYIGNRKHLFLKIKEEISKIKYSIIILNYFPLCSLMKFFINIPIIVDIRTSYILNNTLKRFFYNAFLSLETRCFSNISAISLGLVKYLYLPRRTHIIPLGAPEFPLQDKDFSELKLIYVGTFYDRNIPLTIKAFYKFYCEYSSKIHIQYDIIGFGSENEVMELKNAISETGLLNVIQYHGSIRYPELEIFLKKSNIGISYIPLTRYYDCQPPTKTYEYLLSGMAVLATATSENRKVITDETGITIGDTFEDFYNGLIKIYINRIKYNSRTIQENSKIFTWEKIVFENLEPFIKNILPK